MAQGPSVESMLRDARKALDNANKFTQSVTHGGPDMFHKEPQPHPVTPPSPSHHSYTLPHQMRKGGEFMGVNSNQAPELNTALEQREQTRKMLNQ